MGLAASQATLLQITARIHDVEFEAQQIQYAKMRLALQEDEVQQKYLDALDEQTLTIAGKDGSRIAATFDNICGLGSINNNIASRGNYIFYDENSNLVVPSDVYNGYMNYGGSDPYEFAMFMLMGEETFRANNSEDNNRYNEVLDELANNQNNTALNEVREELYKLIDNIYSKTAGANEDPSNDDLKENQESWMQQLKSGDILSIYNTFFKANGDSDLLKESDIPDDIAEGIKNILKKFGEYEYCLYKKNSGAKEIYEQVTHEKDSFDMNKFNYYLRWGQLIEREGGIEVYKDGSRDIPGCVSAGLLEGLESNPELLNEMVMYGKLSIDIVYDNGSAGISSTLTSPTTDSVLSFQNKSTVDSTALKKAEAEYNRELKKINQIDKRYDLSLNRLETERNALTKQYDSVKKVAEDNVERTFGIFS